MFSSTEGRQILRQNCRVDRVAMISMHNGHEYPDFKGIQEELTDTAIKLAPIGVTVRGEVIIHCFNDIILLSCTAIFEFLLNSSILINTQYHFYFIFGVVFKVYSKSSHFFFLACTKEKQNLRRGQNF